MKIVGIIPSRFDSSRFPGKPLAIINGKSMVNRVFDQANKASALSSIVVATDDNRIYDHVLEFGGSAAMTSNTLTSGTERCAVVASELFQNSDVVINIQGDEPYIHPDQINMVADCFKNKDTQIATLVKVITDESELHNPNIPKVVFEKKTGKALYFSRSCIPYCSNESIKANLDDGLFYKHIGIYGYRTAVLTELVTLEASTLEISEMLEQLRWLENGYSVTVAVTEYTTHSVDVPGDIDKLESFFS
jgi:3-deoxy-manno-octulosonate cytidylyltransferase (CMP-KDO synthetase)